MTKKKTSVPPSGGGIEPRVLRIGDLQKMLRVSRRTIYDWVAEGYFPKSDVRLGRQLRAWRTETVTAWLDSRTDPA